MTFPYTILDQRIELFLSGAWTDITSFVQRRSSLPVIRRGRADEAGSLERSTDGMSLNNRDGRFSPRNPLGPHYGQLNRNTRLRHSLPNASGSYLSLPGSLTDRATCPDASALGITGDIDVRIDLTLDSWRSLQPLVGKWEITSDERSWVLQLNADGTLTLLWTTAGTLASVLYSASTAPVPVPASGRRAVRVTLDVNNGAAGHTATFYYADTITGTWLALGDPVVTSGTTSIYDGTGVVEVGSVVDLDAGEPLTGAVNMFELRSGIAGTVVANPNFMIQTAGDNAFPDTASSPNTWTMQGDSVVDDRDYRFHGEVPAWPARSDTTGQDVWVPIEAAGILRRLGQGAEALDSVMRRVVPMSSTPGPAAYWPCEDESSATQIASALPGVTAMHVRGEPSFASSTVFACSDALPTVGESVWTGGVPPYTPVGDLNDVRWLMHIPSSGVTNGAVLMRIISTEYTAHRWDITYTTTSSGTVILTVYDSYSTLLHTSPPITGVDGVVAFWQFQEGMASATEVSYFLTMINVDGTSGVSTMGSVTPAEFGRVNSVIVGPNANVGTATIGHISVHGTSEIESVLYNSLTAYDGEPAGRRIERLCAEQEITFRSYGDLDSTPAMGPQPVDTLLNLMAECVDTDGGLLSEPRDVFGFGYLPRTSLYNQETCLTLDYSAGECFEELQPTGDDRYLRNRVTVSRRNGSSATEQLETGPLSIQQAPDGVGVYPESVRINTQTDEGLRGHAAWRVHLGTVDEERFPEITVNLANPRIAADATLVAAASAVDIGSVVAITNPPLWLPPGTISQLVQGTTEILGNYERSLSFNASPASPYTVGVTDTAGARADTDGSTLGAAATSSATTLVVHTTQTDVGQVPLWTQDPSDYPLDLRVGGEVVTASAAASLIVDSFTRTVAAGGWGTASDGHTYTLVGSAASDRSVAATYGVVTLPSSPATLRHQVVAETCQDCEVRAAVAVSATATGNSLTAGLAARYVDSSNFYRLRIEFTTAGGISLTVTRNITGVGSTVSTGVTYTPGSVIEVRMRLIGHRMLARVWSTGTAEPVVWHIDETVVSSVITDGFVGLVASGISGNSNVLPEIRFHDWLIETPQRITATRSTNGITKSHSAGTDVRLAYPTIIAP